MIGMSAIGTKRTFQGAQLMSAFGGKSDIARTRTWEFQKLLSYA
jgi:hypothetical protein